jgi:hypothetical protein
MFLSLLSILHPHMILSKLIILSSCMFLS